MKVVIVGIGKVGYYLAKILIESGHDVSVIERDKELCYKLANEVDIPIIHADATYIQSLEEAAIQESEVLVATTGKDEENLLICQRVQMHFSAIKTIARINNPKNEKIFKALGIKYTVSSTNIIASIIEEEVIIKGLRTLMTIDKEGISLVEYYINKTSVAKGKKIKMLDLPSESNIAYIVRDHVGIVPRGDVILEEGDRMIVVVSAHEKKVLDKILK